jgi:DNA-binding response OmpR family regulator
MAAAAAAQMLRSVLIVEDDVDSRDVMERLVRSASCDVRGTPSVGEALVFLEDEENLPTHIVLDLMLPDAGGIVVLRSVRRRQLPIRIAIVTGAGPESNVLTTALRWQPDAVFHKPIDFKQVRAWLEQE